MAEDFRQKLGSFQKQKGWGTGEMPPAEGVKQNTRPAPSSGGGGGRPPQPPSGRGGGGNPPPGRLPAGYLKGGYFDETGNIRPELLLDHARDIARAIGQPPAAIKNAQLRKFYGHVKAAETRMNYEVPFDAVKAQVLELGAFVAEAQGKGKVPQIFRDFIDENLANISDHKSFRQGFVKHFQAVVGYFSSFYKE